MKSFMVRLIVFAVGLFMVGVSVGRAQIINQLDFKVAKPFTVANTTFDAGSYVVRQVWGSDSTVLEIVSASGHPGVLVDAFAAQPDSSQDGSHLIFNKYANVLALLESFPGGGSTG